MKLYASLSLGLAFLPFATATVHHVDVGESGLVFNPQAISAQPGDQVVFTFYAKNHTATQSSFAAPCDFKQGGIDSGFMPVPDNQTSNLPTWTVAINDTNPLWIYCKQGAGTPASHCGQGMVFAVNCGPDGSPNSFSAFKQAALSVGASLSAAAATATTPTGAATAAYGSVTIPPAPEISTVTETITLSGSTWTTTYGSYPGSPNATPASLQGNVHKVTVGSANASLIFDPPHLAASPRDVIMFEFHQKNHSATQSSFADPCRPLNANGVTGFDSGFMSVSDSQTDNFPTFNVTVNDTSPVWVYCRQQTPKSHCGAGMVFAVNSVEDSPRNFSAFQALAEQLNGTSSSGTASPSASPTNSGARTGGSAIFTLLAVLLVAFAL